MYSHGPQTGVDTHPELVGVLIEWLYDHGAEEIVLGEGTGFFNKPDKFKELEEKSGYGELSSKMGLEFINLQYIERDDYEWEFGTLKLPKILKTHEYINLPSMKTHALTTVTLALKNQKGLLLLQDKQDFHKNGLHEQIKALYRIISPDLTICDGIYAVQGDGPTVPPGKTIQANLLIGGLDAMEADVATAKIMGFDISKIKHLDSLNVEIISCGLSLDEALIPFEPPVGKSHIGSFHILANERCCTLCQMTLSATMRKVMFTPELNEKFQKLERHDIIMGREHPYANDHGIFLCMGLCTKEFAEKYNNGVYIKRCPPSYKEVINHLFPGYYDIEVT